MFWHVLTIQNVEQEDSGDSDVDLSKAGHVGNHDRAPNCNSAFVGDWGDCGDRQVQEEINFADIWKHLALQFLVPNLDLSFARARKEFLWIGSFQVGVWYYNVL